MVGYSFSVKLDKQQDSWNWYDGCNCSSYGVDWKKRAPLEVYQNIHGKDEKAAYKYIDLFLDQKFRLQERASRF
jgi:hypothetical protein